MTIPTLKTVVSLHDRRERYATRNFIGEGLRSCNTLIQGATRLQALFITDTLDPSCLDKAVDRALVMQVSEKTMKRMSSAVTPSGILGVFSMPEQPPLEAMGSGIVMAAIADPGNMGTIIRTTLALGYTTMVVVGGVDPWSPKVVQASAGYVAHGKLFQCDWQSLVSAAKHNAIDLVALTVTGGASPAAMVFGTTLLVVGNEAHGIGPAQLSDCTAAMTLPMPGHTESLNAAIAASIALYEMHRQQVVQEQAKR